MLDIDEKLLVVATAVLALALLATEYLRERRTEADVTLSAGRLGSTQPVRLTDLPPQANSRLTADARALRVGGAPRSGGGGRSDLEVFVPIGRAGCARLARAGLNACRSGEAVSVAAFSLESVAAVQVEAQVRRARSWSFAPVQSVREGAVASVVVRASAARQFVYVECARAIGLDIAIPGRREAMRCEPEGRTLNLRVDPGRGQQPVISLHGVEEPNVVARGMRLATVLNGGALEVGSGGARFNRTGRALRVEAAEGRPLTANFATSRRGEGTLEVESFGASAVRVDGANVIPSWFDDHEAVWLVALGVLASGWVAAVGSLLVRRYR